MATTTSSFQSYLTGKLAGVKRLSYFRTPVYIMGLHLFKPPQDWAVSFADLQEIGKKQFRHKDEKISSFNYKMAENAGVRKEGSYLPPGITRSKHPGEPKDTSIRAAREEAEEVMFTSVRELLEEKGLGGDGHVLHLLKGESLRTGDHGDNKEIQNAPLQQLHVA